MPTRSKENSNLVRLSLVLRLMIILIIPGIDFSFIPASTMPTSNLSTSSAEWSELVPAGAPSARFWHTMAYDPDRQVTVMFGGLDGKDVNNQTWEFSGTTWVQKTPTFSPPPNYGAAMAYDPDRHEMLLFAQETYIWDGANWTKLISAGNPPQASFSMMAYDSVRHIMVLVGGGSSRETWEWNGTDWAQQMTAHHPSANQYASMAYDEAGGKIILFGGQNGPAPFSDETWEYDGTDWTQRFPIVSPSLRYGHTMAYDRTINRVILFGGANITDDYNDIWEWDGNGNTWLLRSAVGMVPEARTFSGMAYDSTHGVAIMFGGRIERETYKLFDDTWAWNSVTNTWTNLVGPDGQTPSRYGAFAYDKQHQQGVLFGGNTNVHTDAFIGETWIWNSVSADWTRRIPAHSPSPRATNTLVYDSGRHVTLLFGGYRCCQILGDMWEWDGLDWQQLFPGQMPSPRQYMDMVYDSQRDRVVLFGGKFGGANNDNYDDTWEWNGVNWTERFPAHSPSPRYRFKMAYDTARHVTILYGGIDNDNTRLHDTWEWDGTDWTLRSSSQVPIVSAEYGMAFDELRGVTVLFSGTGAQEEVHNETWEWDGNGWNQVSTANTPSERLGASMIYDPTRRSIILFGGDSSTLLDDTWEYKVGQTSNQAPIVGAGGPYTGSEGSSVALNTASASDPDNDSLTYAWSVNSPICSFSNPNTLKPAITCRDNGNFTVILAVNDGVNNPVSRQATVVVDNISPTVRAITAPISPVQINTAIITSANFTDPGTLDTHTAIWDWEGSTSAGTVNETNGSGSVTGSHTYTAPGVYTVKVTVTDDDGDSSQSVFQYVVVYDPNGGFVTGGGWINSPPGAYPINPSLTGQANFGFVSKYQKGATVPTGNTEFQFHVANLNFQSTSYDWLVIAGTKAQYKGTGTIKGAGNYGFLLTATDGTPDKFRIKIWDKATGNIVYDNMLGAADDANPTTGIAGGSIIIHK